MLLRRTGKGQAELRSRERGLQLRERSILFLADGTRTLAMLEPVLGGEGREIVERLVVSGYLELRPVRPAADAARAPEPALAAAPARHQADTLTGKRSLAATRMFLFDLCERTFARGAPQQAGLFRERLRHARDGRAMLVVAQEMLVQLEELAGWERAQAVRDRIEALLPPPGEETQA